MNDKDLRIRKTKHSIKEAFLQLLKEKPLHEITVKEIADKAQCNRNTFYLHYVDKYDLIEKLCNSQLDILIQTLYETRSRQYESPVHHSADIAGRCLDCIEEDMFFYRVMLGQNQNLDFAYRMRKVLVDFIADSINVQEQDRKRKILESEFSASGMVGVIHYWLFHPQEYSKEEILQELQSVIERLGNLLLPSHV